MIRKAPNKNQGIKQEQKRTFLFLKAIVIKYMNLYSLAPDKNSQDLADKFTELDHKWVDACNRKWKYTQPKKEAFEEKIKAIVDEEEKKIIVSVVSDGKGTVRELIDE